jgi:hypothetical protein
MPSRIANAQGIYYLISGLWPILSMSTFEAVTGRKTDRWLVKTVGLLAAVIGVSLLRDPDRRSDRSLPVTAALAFAAVDIVYSAKGTIRPVYLVDGVVELAIAAAWMRSRPGPSALTVRRAQ